MSDPSLPEDPTAQAARTHAVSLAEPLLWADHLPSHWEQVSFRPVETRALHPDVLNLPHRPAEVPGSGDRREVPSQLKGYLWQGKGWPWSPSTHA